MRFFATWRGHCAATLCRSRRQLAFDQLALDLKKRQDLLQLQLDRPTILHACDVRYAALDHTLPSRRAVCIVCILSPLQVIRLPHEPATDLNALKPASTLSYDLLHEKDPFSLRRASSMMSKKVREAVVAGGRTSYLCLSLCAFASRR